MGISFVYEKDNNELIKYITKECGGYVKTSNVKIFVIYTFEELEKARKDRSKNKIIITNNLSRDFVNKALDITENIIYKDMESSVIAERIITILGKCNKHES